MVGDVSKLLMIYLASKWFYFHYFITCLFFNFINAQNQLYVEISSSPRVVLHCQNENSVPKFVSALTCIIIFHQMSSLFGPFKTKTKYVLLRNNHDTVQEYIKIYEIKLIDLYQIATTVFISFYQFRKLQLIT